MRTGNDSTCFVSPDRLAGVTNHPHADSAVWLRLFAGDGAFVAPPQSGIQLTKDG